MTDSRLQSPVLSISNLNVMFRAGEDWKSVVRNISIDVPAGKTVAIVGESGSGKSVTALSVTRLHNPAMSRVEGSVKLAGRELLTLPEAHMREVRGGDISMIFQEPMTSLNPVLTIGRQIGETLKRHRGLGEAAARQETIRLLERVRIPAASSRINEYPHRFSGGMRQRVMIAMALACKPKVLIADEPTTALDVTIQAQILELIKSIQAEEGMGVLFITHDMGVVAEISDQTVVMFRGDIVESGETANIFRNPAHDYTRRLLAAVPRLGSMSGTTAPRPFSIPGEPDAIAEPAEALHPDETVLSVRDLTKRFPISGGLMGGQIGQVHAVEGVSFDLKKGETLSLVGESGCGKSTTGRLVLRLLEADAGSAILDGQDVMTVSGEKLRSIRQGMQMIFQDPFASLNPRLTVGFAIAEPMKAHGLFSAAERKERVAMLLEQVGLSADMQHRYPHEFSGGQRQRICIARALSLEPKVIVADESVSALDVSVKAQVVNLMMDLQSRLGISYLFISHDMAVVERVSHRVAVMYLGQIVEIGARRDVFENPQHPYTRRLLDAVPVPDPDRRFMPRNIADTEIRSPFWPKGFVMPRPEYVQVGPDHIVQKLTPEWEAKSA